MSDNEPKKEESAEYIDFIRRIVEDDIATGKVNLLTT